MNDNKLFAMVALKVLSIVIIAMFLGHLVSVVQK